MKKVKLFFVVILFSIFSGAYAQFTFGVRGGLNLSNISSSDDSVNEELKPKL